MRKARLSIEGNHIHTRTGTIIYFHLRTISGYISFHRLCPFRWCAKQYIQIYFCLWPYCSLFTIKWICVQRVHILIFLLLHLITMMVSDMFLPAEDPCKIGFLFLVSFRIWFFVFFFFSDLNFLLWFGCDSSVSSSLYSQFISSIFRYFFSLLFVVAQTTLSQTQHCTNTLDPSDVLFYYDLLLLTTLIIIYMMCVRSSTRTNLSSTWTDRWNETEPSVPHLAKMMMTIDQKCRRNAARLAAARTTKSSGTEIPYVTSRHTHTDRHTQTTTAQQQELQQ